MLNLSIDFHVCFIQNSYNPRLEVCKRFVYSYPASTGSGSLRHGCDIKDKLQLLLSRDKYINKYKSTYTGHHVNMDRLLRARTANAKSINLDNFSTCILHLSLSG